MAVSQAQKMAKEKYRNEKRDQMTIEVPKGKRDAYKLIAAELGLSLSMLVQASVEDYGANHAGKVVVPATRQETETISAEERRLIQSFANLPDNVKPTIKKLVEQLAQSSA